MEDKIKSVYRNYYTELFENPKDKKMVEQVNIKIEEIKIQAKDQEPLVISKKAIKEGTKN